MGAEASSAIKLKKIPVLKASRFAPQRQMVSELEVSELEEES